MKIGLDTAPAALRGTYFQHLASVLARYAPEHEYIIGAEVNDGVDLYHGFRSSLPLSVHLRRVPSVMTVPNLNFLRYPHLYTFAERLFRLRAEIHLKRNLNMCAASMLFQSILY